MRIRELIIGIFALVSIPCFGQNNLTVKSYLSKYSIKNYSVNDGLFSQQVYKIHKDKVGFYWVVSNGELLRFDGLSFKEFKKGNSGGTLYDLAEDSKGNFWIPSFGIGLYKFNGDSLESFKSQTGDLTKAVALGNADTLMVGTYGDGLQIFYKDSVVQTFTTENGLIGDEIWTIEKDNNGKFWIGTNSGISIFDNGKFKNYSLNNGLPDNKIRAIKQLKNGEVWVGTDKEGIVVFKNEEPVRNIHTKDGLPSLLIQDIQQDKSGAILVATLGGGIARFTYDKVETFDKEDGIISNEINSINLSDDGLVLLGTEDGMSMLVPKIFNTLSIDGETPFTQEAVTLNKDGKNRLWVGTYGQGYRVFEDGEWNSLENPPKNTNGYAQSGAIDSDGNLWVGTQGSGVFQVVGNEFIERFTTKNGLFDDYVRGLTFDKNGNLWVGSNKGISVYDSSSKLIETYSSEDEIPNAFCITMFTASDGSVWYGSFGGGVVRFKNGNKTIYNTEKGLKSDQVLSIYEDSNHDIWIGTFNYGLSKVVGDSLFTLSDIDGLPTVNYAGIIEDNSKNIWLATGNGVLKISLSNLSDYQRGDLENLPFHYFNNEDGLVSDNLQAANNSTLTKLEDGTLVFGSIDGVFLINPEKAEIDTSPFEPYIDEINIDDKMSFYNEYFELNPDQKKLSISFSAINFRAPNKTRFRVQLSGIDDSWVYMDNRTTVYYDYLPHGDYTFVVSAIGPDGQWSDNTDSVTFTVHPPFYNTWWFYTISALFAGGFIAGMVQFQSNIKVKRLNRELAFQQKMHQEKERISRDLHDNVGAQISNLITGIEISNIHIQKGQQQDAINILQNLDEDARNAMSDLRETIWLLDKDEIEIEDFIKHIQSYIRKQKRYFAGINIETDCDINVSFTLDSKQSLNLMRIIQEALNNARKYAEATLINLTINCIDNTLQLSITDNGKGMDIDEQKEKGNGLQNMRIRAEHMGGDLDISSENSVGTTIKLSFPV